MPNSVCIMMQITCLATPERPAQDDADSTMRCIVMVCILDGRASRLVIVLRLIVPQSERRFRGLTVVILVAFLGVRTFLT